MTRYYDTIAEFEREGYEIIVDKSYEDLDPKDCFDDSCFNIKEMYADIESGKLDWFMLRVRVLVEGLELGSQYLGGCLYENPADVMTDGTADDLIAEAIAEAKKEVYRLSRKFTELSYAADAEGVTV